MMERKFPCIFVPGTKVVRNESSQKRMLLSLPGAKVPKSEKAIIPEWCVECGNLVIKTFYIAYCLPLLASLIFFKL